LGDISAFHSILQISTLVLCVCIWKTGCYIEFGENNLIPFPKEIVRIFMISSI
jgi:hypothetical protein